MVRRLQTRRVHHAGEPIPRVQVSEGRIRNDGPPGLGQQPQYPEQGNGQQYPQGQPWQPQQYDPRQHQRKMDQQPESSQQSYGQPYPPGQPRQQASPWGQPSWQEPGQYQQPQPPGRRRSRIPLYAAIAAVIVIARGGAAYALAGRGSSKRLTCAQQYQAWKTGPADILAKRTFGPDDTALTAAGNSDDIPAMDSALAKLGQDAGRLEQYPMPACADPAGYWTQMLADLKAAGDNAGSTSGLGGLITAMAPAEIVKPLETELSAELARTAGVKTTP